MCGIAAFINPAERLLFTAHQLKQAARRLAHRGPDDEGFLLVDQNFRPSEATSELFPPPERLFNHQQIGNFSDAYYRLGMAHRRLSIIAPDESGHQPMGTTNGRYWISFNGEIYNYKEIKQDLIGRGFVFHSQTDTEVILKAWEAFGPDCLERFEGMWALFLVDLETGNFYAAVDRSGVKPLYFWKQDGGICLASEIKAIQDFGHNYKPNLATISRYLTSGKTDETAETLFDGIYRLSAGRILKINLANGHFEIRQWHRWNSNAQLNRWSAKAEQEALEHIRMRLSESLALRLRSDVPLGICLSGGIDSSAIAGSLSKTGNPDFFQPRKAFMARLHSGQGPDEYAFALEMAKSAGFELYTTSPTAHDFLTHFEDLIYTLDEPPPGLNAFSQFAVFRLVASHGVKVSLDGQGADELFAGYPAHVLAWKMEHILRGKPVMEFSPLLQYLRTLLPHEWEFHLLKKWKPEFALFSEPSLVNEKEGRLALPSLNEVLRRDFESQTLPFLLKAGDRNSMRWGVESRVPFADSHDLIELTFSIPGSNKIQNGLSKVLLRKAMSARVPPSILNRRDKVGFAAPNLEWIRHLIGNGFEPPEKDEWGLSHPKLFGNLAASLQKENSKTDFHILWRAMAYWQWKKCFFPHD